MSKKPNRHTPQPYGHATPWSRRAAEDAAIAAAAENAAAEGAATSAAAVKAAEATAAREATSAPDQAAPDSAAAHRSAPGPAALNSGRAFTGVPSSARRVARLWPGALATVLAAVVMSRLVYGAALNRPYRVRLGS